MYSTPDQFKNELEQLQDTTAHDTVVLEKLEHANALVNLHIGATSDLTAAAASTRVIYGDGGLFLSSDIPMSTVTLVTSLTGYTVPDYMLVDGMLRITDSTGVVVYPYAPSLGGYSWWSNYGGWLRGVPYSVTAVFGFSAQDIAILAEAELQTAVQLFRYRDAGGSETIGSEGAITTVRAGWSPLIKDGLASIKRRMRGNSVGVF